MDQIQMQAWTAGALKSLQEKTDLLEEEISRAVEQFSKSQKNTTEWSKTLQFSQD